MLNLYIQCLCKSRVLFQYLITLMDYVVKQLQDEYLAAGEDKKDSLRESDWISLLTQRLLTISMKMMDFWDFASRKSSRNRACINHW